MKTIFTLTAALLFSTAIVAAPQDAKKGATQKVEAQKAEATVLPDASASLKTLKEGAGVLTELSPVPVMKNWQDSEILPRSFAQQPPLIPHTVKGYVINLKFNKCLTCHSDENAKISGATPVGKSHYNMRDGMPTQKIAGRRYFCVQCHVPQISDNPLFGNDFTTEGAAP